MADPAKHKSVSIPIKYYNLLDFINGKLDTPLSKSKLVQMSIVKEAKKHGYKNGKA
jgi:hypothetical protein